MFNTAKAAQSQPGVLRSVCGSPIYSMLDLGTPCLKWSVLGGQFPDQRGHRIGPAYASCRGVMQ